MEFKRTGNTKKVLKVGNPLFGEYPTVMEWLSEKGFSKDYIKMRMPEEIPETSYPLGRQKDAQC